MTMTRETMTSDGDDSPQLNESFSRRISMTGEIELSSSTDFKLQTLNPGTEIALAFQGIEQYLSDDDTVSNTSNTMEDSEQSLSAQDIEYGKPKEAVKTSSTSRSKEMNKSNLPEFPSMEDLNEISPTSEGASSTARPSSIMKGGDRRRNLKSKVSFRVDPPGKTLTNLRFEVVEDKIPSSLSSLRRTMNTWDLGSGSDMKNMDSSSSGNRIYGRWRAFLKGNFGGAELDKQDHDSLDGEKDQTLQHRVCIWLYKNEMAVLLMLAIALARAYPPLGAEYLFPHITTSWILVPFIMFMAGLGLKTRTLTRSCRRPMFNCCVQFFCFGVDSLIAFGITRGLVALGTISDSLAGGIIACACLPMTIGSVTSLTKGSGGDAGSAFVNSTLANFLGVFLSPTLMVGYVGTLSGDGMGVACRLSLRIIGPILAGQIAQACFTGCSELKIKHKKIIAKIQIYALFLVVYTIFCQTFAQPYIDATIYDILIMIMSQLLLFILFLIVSWGTFYLVAPRQPNLRVVALFACTQKSLLLGAPLICTAFDDYDSVALYLVPLLVWYPTQIVIGSLLVPRLHRITSSENTRLVGVEEEDQDDSKERTTIIEVPAA